MASQNEIDRMKRLIDQQHKSGGTIGQQFFNNSGLSSNLAGMARAYAQRRGYGLGNAWRGGGGGGRGGTSDGLRNAVDERAKSGGALGDEWFNSSGLGAENRQAAMDYAASRGYTLGNAWADIKNPIFNSAGDQVRRTPYERNEASLAYRDQLKKQYGDNFYEAFIPGLLQPGMQGYDAATGGGRYAYSQNPIDADALRFSFRNTEFGTDTKLTPEQREQYSLQGLYGGYGAPAGFNAGQQQQGADPAGATAEGPNASNMKKFRGIRQGLRIMDRNMILSDKEARQIAKKTGKSYDDVIAAALKNKMTINSKAVKKSNERYNRRNPFGVSAFSTDPLRMMRNVRVGRGNVYGNTYKVDGVEQVNVAPRGGRNRRNPLTIQAPAADAEYSLPTGMPDYGDFQDGFMGSIDATPEVKLPGQQLGGGIGSKGATGITRTRSRIRRLGIGNYGSSLLGRNLQYGNFINR